MLEKNRSNIANALQSDNIPNHIKRKKFVYSICVSSAIFHNLRSRFKTSNRMIFFLSPTLFLTVKAIVMPRTLSNESFPPRRLAHRPSSDSLSRFLCRFGIISEGAEIKSNDQRSVGFLLLLFWKR